MSAAPSSIQPAVGGMTDEQIRDRVDALDAERSALMDEYCRRWPAGVVDAEDTAWALASTSPAQTGGVDQAWVDKAMELADQYFLRRHWHEGHIDAARAELRTHLSTALGAAKKE